MGEFRCAIIAADNLKLKAASTLAFVSAASLVNLKSKRGFSQARFLSWL